jgi:hypothetical protein
MQEQPLNVTRSRSGDINVSNRTLGIDSTIPHGEFNAFLQLLVATHRIDTLRLIFHNVDNALLGVGRFDVSINASGKLDMIPNPSEESVGCDKYYFGGVALMSRQPLGVLLSLHLPIDELNEFDTMFDPRKRPSHVHITENKGLTFTHNDIVQENALILDGLNKHGVKMIAMGKGRAHVTPSRLDFVTPSTLTHPIVPNDFKQTRLLPLAEAFNIKRLLQAYQKVGSHLQDDSQWPQLRKDDPSQVLYKPVEGSKSRYDLNQIACLSDEQLDTFAEHTHAEAITHRVDNLKNTGKQQIAPLTPDNVTDMLAEDLMYVYTPNELAKITEIALVALGGEVNATLRHDIQRKAATHGVEDGGSFIRDMASNIGGIVPKAQIDKVIPDTPASPKKSHMSGPTP